MCDDLNCPNREIRLCSCSAIKDPDADKMIGHIFQNVRNVHFALDYGTLDEKEQRIFRVLGSCETCGGALCCCMRVEPLRGGDVMEWLYSAARSACELTRADVGENVFIHLFVSMFHKQDQAYAEAWLFERIQRDAMKWRKIYTIVRTGCDADHCLFPDPSAEGSYLAQSVAIKELERLIEEEKKTVSPRFDHEDRGETWWEMNEDGLAALHFVRLEIVESRLNTDEG